MSGHPVGASSGCSCTLGERVLGDCFTIRTFARFVPRSLQSDTLASLTELSSQSHSGRDVRTLFPQVRFQMYPVQHLANSDWPRPLGHREFTLGINVQ